MIEAVNLCKQFERTTKEGRKTKKQEFLAVDHVSLEAGRGEIVGILGPNGAGKTTFLRLLLGREKGVFGEIKILGKTMPAERVDILQQVGFVSEDNDFFHELSPLENEAQYAPLYSHWDGQVYRKKLKEFGIGFSTKISSLSKGNKVRFQLAFALAQRRFVSVVASDAHGAHQRTPWMYDAWDLLARYVSPIAAEQLLLENPRRIINDEPVVPMQPEWFHREF